MFLHGRFVKHYLVLIFVNQMASALFRLIGALGRNIVVASALSAFTFLAILVLGGFVLSRGKKKKAIVIEHTLDSLP